MTAQMCMFTNINSSPQDLYTMILTPPISLWLGAMLKWQNYAWNIFLGHEVSAAQKCV